MLKLWLKIDWNTDRGNKENLVFATNPDPYIFATQCRRP